MHHAGSTATLEPPGIARRLPPEVEFVMSALEAGKRPLVERQKLKRITHRVRAKLRLFSDPPHSPPRELFTRHVNREALGFIARYAIPLSHGGAIELPSLDGRILRIPCTVLRCRPAGPGWWEGAVYFNRDQPAFADEL